MTSASDLDFGIYLPQVAFGYDTILERARIIEELGFHSLWLYDHLYSPGIPDAPSFESWTLATALLAQTERLRVGHLVLCNNFRHPVMLAKMATTLDVISGGRLDLGLGSGSVEQEHHEAGLPWGTRTERSERLAESLEIMTSMFTGEPTTVTGRHYQVRGLPNLPRPTQQPGPPIHIGGMGPHLTLPLVARYADVWNVPTYGLANWEESQRHLEAACAEVGRDPNTIRRSHEAVLVLAPDEAALGEARAIAERRYGGPGWGMEAGGYIGTPPMVADRIADLADKGVTLFVFFTYDRGDPKTIELFADQVLPRLR